MQGFLTRNNNGIWEVKWSDLHSFGHGTHWMFTELSPDSNVIKIIKENRLRYQPLEEGVKVEFELVITSYDKESYAPIYSAKLIFPDVDAFEKEESIKEYVESGGELFSISKITHIRDGGTIALLKTPGNKSNQFYIHKDNWTLHYGYPTTDENLVRQEATRVYVMDRLQKYKTECKDAFEETKRIIERMK